MCQREAPGSDHLSKTAAAKATTARFSTGYQGLVLVSVQITKVVLMRTLGNYLDLLFLSILLQRL